MTGLDAHPGPLRPAPGLRRGKHGRHSERCHPGTCPCVSFFCCCCFFFKKKRERGRGRESARFVLSKSVFLYPHFPPFPSFLSFSVFCFCFLFSFSVFFSFFFFLMYERHELWKCSSPIWKHSRTLPTRASRTWSCFGNNAE